MVDGADDEWEIHDGWIEETDEERIGRECADHITRIVKMMASMQKYTYMKDQAE